MDITYGEGYNSKHVPTKDFYTIKFNKTNIISELSSSKENKHIFGSDNYGQIFVRQGFPSFGYLYAYNSINAFDIYNPESKTIVKETNKNIKNSANVNVIRIKAGERRDKISLVDNNYSDISNIPYGLFGIIDTSSTHMSPLGLDCNWTVRNRMFWENSSVSDGFNFSKVYYIRYDSDGHPIEVLHSPYYYVGNDRPYLYDTRVQLYSGPYAYKEAFGVKVKIRVYNSDYKVDRDYQYQGNISKSSYNSSIHAVYDIDLVGSFKDLKDSASNPNVGILRYESDLLKRRRFNESHTDSLVLYLSDFYTNGEIWDTLFNKKRRVKELDIDIVVTVEEHTSRLQPDMVNINKDSILSNSFNLSQLDYLSSSDLDQYTVVRNFDPSSFSYFSRPGAYLRANYDYNTEEDQDVPPAGQSDFPLCGSFKLVDIWPKNAPNGVSKSSKQDGSFSFYSLDISNATYTILPPPFQQLSNGTRSRSFFRAESDDDATMEFRSSVDGHALTWNDGANKLNEYDSFFCAKPLSYRMYSLLRYAPLSIKDTTPDNTQTGIASKYMLYRSHKFFTPQNPFESSPTDQMWIMPITDYVAILKGKYPFGWSSTHLQPYDGSNTGSDGIQIIKDPKWSNTLNYKSVWPESWDAIQGTSTNFPITNANFSEQTNADDLHRVNTNGFVFIPGVASSIIPFNSGVDKKFYGIRSYLHDRIFNENVGFVIYAKETVNYWMRNTSISGAHSDANELTTAFLPIEDILYAYDIESSNVISVVYDEASNEIKTTIDISGYTGWGWGDGSDVEPTNIANFVEAISDEDVITIQNMNVAMPIYLRKDIKLLPNVKKIVYEMNSQEYIDLVNRFIKGNWSVYTGGESIIKRFMVKVFDLPDVDTLENLDISTLLNPNSVFYEYGSYYSPVSKLSWYIILWQLFLYFQYREIWDNITEDCKIHAKGDADIFPYAFYHEYGSGSDNGSDWWHLSTIEDLFAKIDAQGDGDLTNPFIRYLHIGYLEAFVVFLHNLENYSWSDGNTFEDYW